MWRKIIVTFSIVLAVIMVAFIIYAETHEKKYTINNVAIDAHILDNGGMQIVEERTVTFENGPFTKLTMDILKKGFKDITDVEILEGTKEYQPVANNTKDTPEGYYRISQDDNNVHIEWYVYEIDGTRTFTLKYTVEDCINIYKDTAELYWKFIGDKNGTETAKCSVRVHLPENVGKNDIKVWGHGAENGTVQIVSGQEAFWVTKNLPANKFLEARMLFPPNLIVSGGITFDHNGLPNILAEEEQWAQEQQSKAAKDAMSFIIGLLVLGASTGISMFILMTRGRRFKPTIKLDYYRELPGDYTPAEMCVLYTFNKPKQTAIPATILDLARRKVIKLFVDKSGKKPDVILERVRENEGNLLAFELSLVNYMFNEIGQNGRMAISAMKKASKDKSNNLKDFIDGWKREIIEAGKKRDFFDQRSLTGRTMLGVVFSVLVIAAAVLLLNKFYTPAIFTGLGACITIAAHALVGRRSPYGEEQFMRWKAFSRFPKDFSSLNQAELPDLILWEHYLVYAVALGVSQKVLKQLPVVYPDIIEHTGYAHYAWYGLYFDSPDISAFGDITMALTGIEAGFDAVTSNISASSDGSGGFSSGGGGGGGGGGFGAS